MNTILTDDEIDAAREVARKTFRRSRSQIRGQQITAEDDPEWHLARAVEAAVLAKLVQQEPVAWAHSSGGYLSNDYMTRYATGLEKQTHTIPLYTHPAPQQADRQRVPGPAHNYHQLREALIFADQAMAESGLLACHAVRIQIRAALDNAAAPEAPANKSK